MEAFNFDALGNYFRMSTVSLYERFAATYAKEKDNFDEVTLIIDSFATDEELKEFAKENENSFKEILDIRSVYDKYQNSCLVSMLDLLQDPSSKSLSDDELQDKIELIYSSTCHPGTPSPFLFVEKLENEILTPYISSLSKNCPESKSALDCFEKEKPYTLAHEQLQNKNTLNKELADYFKTKLSESEFVDCGSLRELVSEVDIVRTLDSDVKTANFFDIREKIKKFDINSKLQQIDDIYAKLSTDLNFKKMAAFGKVFGYLIQLNPQITLDIEKKCINKSGLSFGISTEDVKQDIQDLGMINLIDYINNLESEAEKSNDNVQYACQVAIDSMDDPDGMDMLLADNLRYIFNAIQKINEAKSTLKSFFEARREKIELMFQEFAKEVFQERANLKNRLEYISELERVMKFVFPGVNDVFNELSSALSAINDNADNIHIEINAQPCISCVKEYIESDAAKDQLKIAIESHKSPKNAIDNTVSLFRDFTQVVFAPKTITALSLVDSNDVLKNGDAQTLVIDKLNTEIMNVFLNNNENFFEFTKEVQLEKLTSVLKKNPVLQVIKSAAQNIDSRFPVILLPQIISSIHSSLLNLLNYPEDGTVSTLVKDVSILKSKLDHLMNDILSRSATGATANVDGYSEETVKIITASSLNYLELMNFYFSSVISFDNLQENSFVDTSAVKEIAPSDIVVPVKQDVPSTNDDTRLTAYIIAGCAFGACSIAAIIVFMYSRQESKEPLLERI